MSRARAREIGLPILLVVAILAASVGAALALHGIETDHQSDVVAGRQARSDAIVDAAFHAPLERLGQVAAGIEAGGTDFTVLTRQMMRTPEVGAIGLVERVPERDRAAWERRTGLHMRSGVAAGDEPAPARPVHYVVRSVVSRTPVEPGIDIGTDTVRVAAMRRAASLGEATFTPPVTLFGRDSQKTEQLVAFQAVAGGMTGARYVSATFTFEALAANLQETLPQDTSVTIEDGDAQLTSVGDGDGATKSRRLALGGRDLRVRTSVVYSEGTPWDELVIAIGLLVALAVGAFAVAARRREQQVSAQAGERLLERKAVEADLDRERGFSATLISALPDGFVAADSRGIIVVNDAMCELTGYPRKELMGRLFPHGFWPEDSLLEVQRLRDRVTEIGSGEMELMLRTKDDQRVPVVVSASRVEGRHGPIEISLVRDNRERAEATRRLTESEAQLLSLANAATDMVVSLSRSERIEWVSPSAESVLGYRPDELTGRRFNDLFDGEGVGRLNAGGGIHRLRRRDGDMIWADVTVTPKIDAAGALSGMRASVRDVSEREEARVSLQRADARYRLLVRSLPDTIVLMVGTDRRFVLAGGSALPAAGRSTEQIEGRTIEEFMVEPDQLRVIPYLDAALAGRGGDVHHTSDRGREYLLRFVPLRDDHGDVEGALFLAIDVTEQRALQSQAARGASPAV